MKLPTSLVTSFAALLVAHSATAQVFQVNTTNDTIDSNPGDGVALDANGQTSLRAAIQEANALASLGIVRIHLAAGTTYTLTRAGAGEDAAATGDLDVACNVRLSGGNAIVDAGGLDRAFDVMAGSSLRMDRVRIRNGAVVDESGGGVRSMGSLELRECQVWNSSATGAGASGGAVFNDGGTLIARNCQMWGNDCSRAGGAIEADGGGTWLEFSVFADNSTGSMPGNGGGLHLTGAGFVSVVRCRFEGNVASREGGALWNSSGGTMQLTRCEILDNEANGSAADDGGGGLFNDGGTMYVDDCTVSGNRATTGSGSGGGIFNNGGNLAVFGTWIVGNTSNRAGGGVEALNGSTVLVATMMLDNDTGASPGNGGALHLTGAGGVDVEWCAIARNTASAEGGGLWNSGAGVMNVRQCLLIENVASGAAADQGGGALFNAGGMMSVVGCRIIGNDADGASGSGGGIFNDAGVVEVRGCELLDNSSRRAGGGIEANVGMTTVVSTVFVSNVTGSSPGNGGGLHLTGAGAVDLAGCLLFFNRASSEGGGLWNSSTGTMTATGSFAIANSAPDGANLFNDGGTFTFNGNPVF